MSVVERHATPRGEIALVQRGDHYEIISNGTFLMATHSGGESERVLVSAALRRAPRPARVLLGGLGVGYSLGAALAAADVQAVTVVEIEPAVLRWNQGPLAPFSGHGLSDPRVQAVVADLVEWIRQSGPSFEAICLDIDNGPDWTVTAANSALYGDEGLAAVRRRLAPGGVAAFWSAAAAPAFAVRLRRHFGAADALIVAHPRGEPDVVYVAVAAPGP